MLNFFKSFAFPANTSLPLILPLSIVSGILQGVKHAIQDLFEQIMNDVSCPLIHEDNQDSFA